MLAAYLLRELKGRAEVHLGDRVSGAVIAVPASASAAARRATEEAGQLAGLEVKLVGEPTAAAIAFHGDGLSDDDDRAQTTCLVYDLGAGSFTASVIARAGSDLSVVASDGVAGAAGARFDDLIVAALLDQLRERRSLDLDPKAWAGLTGEPRRRRQAALARVRREAERAKLALSAQRSATIALPFLCPNAEGDLVSADLELDRAHLERLIAGPVEDSFAAALRALEQAGLAPETVDAVLPVGASTRLPLVRERLAKTFGAAVRADVDAAASVALGAAMLAMRYFIPHDLPPAAAERVDERLALMGQIMELSGPSLGLRGAGGATIELIPRNSVLPAVGELTVRVLETARLDVVQGGDTRAGILNVRLPDLPPGAAQVALQFRLDENGVLSVTATDIASGRSVTTTHRGGVACAPADLLGPWSMAPRPAGQPVGGAPGMPAALRETWATAQATVPRLGEAARARLERAMAEAQDAVARGDAGRIEATGNDLMDALFDVIDEVEPARDSPPPVTTPAAATTVAPADVVSCSVFAPPEARPGDTLLVQTFLHLAEQAGAVARDAREADAEARRAGGTALAVEIARGTRLVVELRLPGLDVDDPLQAVVWRGHAAAVQFGVAVPAARAPGAVLGKVTVSADDVPLGHVRFKLSVVTTATATAPVPIGEMTHRYRHAFLSYASRDRDEVLKRAQMLARCGIRFFQDILDLEPGERWEPRLYDEIDRCDLFLLFWSAAARDSEWVARELDRALARKRGDDAAPPDIVPVLVEGPPVPAPPQRLAHLHFNEPLLHFLSRRGA